jgi:glycerophosphoryl diester phosphodiesterase
MAEPVARHPWPARRRPWAIAHRGASHVAPENTLSALRSALALGADMVEVDVRRTADGALVLMHDATLRRTTDVTRRFPSRAPWRVQDLTLDQIRSLDAGAWKSSRFVGEQVPTLDEAWEVVLRARSRLLLEVKEPWNQPGIMRDIGSLLGATDPATPLHHHVVVQSFSTRAVRSFARRWPGVPVGLLSPVPAHELPEVATWAAYVNPHHRQVNPTYVAAVRDLGMRCLPWTVDSPRGLRRVLRAGVDGVISNRPDLVRSIRTATVGSGPAD